MTRNSPDSEAAPQLSVNVAKPTVLPPMVIFQRSTRRGSCSSLHRSPFPLYQTTSASTGTGLSSLYHLHRQTRPQAWGILVPILLMDSTYPTISPIPESMIGVGKSAARTSETGSPPALRHSSHRYGIPSDLVLTLVFVQFRVAEHVVTIVNILSHLCGCCESKLTTTGDSSTWYGVSYSKVRHPWQWQDSATTGGQRGNVGMIRRMTKVERLWESSTATAGEAKAGSGDA
jgi:hypothetical protein